MPKQVWLLNLWNALNQETQTKLTFLVMINIVFHLPTGETVYSFLTRWCLTFISSKFHNLLSTIEMFLSNLQCRVLASVVGQKKTRGKSETVCRLPERTMTFHHLQLRKAISLLFLRTHTIITNASSAWKNQRMLLLFTVTQGTAAVAGPVRKS